MFVLYLYESDDVWPKTEAVTLVDWQAQVSTSSLVYGELFGSTKVAISTFVDTWYISTQAFLICRRENM